ncbi:DUF6799 domain-containing protein [Marivirga arenosa]|uniref:DUF6799 domain-containing protein n=1 Tax=Marivirga arenosa TaxID=3059076 RepID=A0AA51X3A8_9BACT|nr:MULTISPECIES: DUF6799 domain-containing protein [unclassified Marivirga]WMN06741.1 DUF6799 domain-containing protein [Marivirga sp. ABR2-2]WNB16927.1 DUF6799 domain-containing protein [Marivirga sp. BKB1-2]
MKKLALVFISMLFLIGTAFAQDQDRDRNQDRVHDHYTLKDGKMYQFKNGEQLMLQNQVRLENGTVINPNGTYQLQNREMKQLRDGECLDMLGKKYRNREHFEKQIKRQRERDMRVKERNKNQEKGTKERKGGGKGNGKNI